VADNVAITAGSGTTISTDDISGVQVQRVKVQYGADGSATDVSTASPMPVSDAGGSLTVDATSLPLPSGAATAAKQPALGTAGSASTDVITVQGIASGTAQPVSDGGGSLTVDDGAGSLTVDGTVAATQSGTWTVQPGNTANTTAWKVDGSAVTQPVSGTVAVSSVSTSITPGTGAANLGKAEDAASADGDVGVGMLAVRKATPANTSGADGDYEFLQVSAGRLWVDASGKTLTVDGSGVTQPVSAASLPLPSGASTAAKQPALGTAGSASTDVITVQGIASGTALRTTAATISTATLANVAAATSSTTVLAANSAAVGRAAFNDSSAAMYLKYGTAASTTSFTVKIAAGGYYEFPSPLYYGAATAVWDSATGSVRTTEW
jgi:hypothetical protein